MDDVRAGLPIHLRKYIVDQNYNKYTPKDHAVWRCTLRQLRHSLSENAHKCYENGLDKTGISTESIPKISDISFKLQKCGWKALPVSGFIPPAAFMELQALGFLPIASDIRTLEQITYTPAPDIVHEAAGHAPILIDSDFTKYLGSYAQVAYKAIINKEDLDLYRAIRILSDIKESSNSSDDEIRQAGNNLKKATEKMEDPSEAALLARMNWWTAEYGLIGDIRSPKIYGAGLLSSIAESSDALTSKVKKIPFSLKCLEYSYDITKPQPQLFVVDSFETLTKALKDIEKTMAFYRGGTYGLKIAKKSQTVNTVECNSGLQICGILTNYKEKQSEPIFIQMQGPTQLCYKGQMIHGHDKRRHLQGFSCPIGKLKGYDQCLSKWNNLESLDLKKENALYEITTEKQLDALQMKCYSLKPNKIQMHFQSGIKVSGIPICLQETPDETPLIITFKDCKVTYYDEVLFDPSWGEFDMAVGSSIHSVFSGPSDREAYGKTDTFINKKKTSIKPQTQKEKQLCELYAKVRKIRLQFNTYKNLPFELKESLEVLEQDFAEDWLLPLEILELSYRITPTPHWQKPLKKRLLDLSLSHKQHAQIIHTGIKMLCP